MSNRYKNRAATLRDMSIAERIGMSRDKSNKLTDRCLELERIHANNRFLIYDSVFDDRLNQTFAGNAFNALCMASFGFELVRLTALWDPPAEDKVSIPEVVALVDDIDVRAQLKNEFDSHYDGEFLRIVSGPWNHVRFERRWRHMIQLTRCIVNSDRLKTLRSHRNKFLAHNLSIPTHSSPRFGQERKLLRSSQHIALALSTVLEDRGLNYDQSRQMNRRHASEFWKGLSWELPPRVESQ